MRCRQAKALLPAHFEKELSEMNRRGLEEHLAACPTCYGYWRRLHRVEHRLIHAGQQTPPLSMPRSDFTASVMLTIAARQREGVPFPTAPSSMTPGISSRPDQGRIEEIRLSSALPLGPWSGWNASALGSWALSSRVVLSGALAVLFVVMAAVVVVGVILTQPVLSTQALSSLASLFSSIADGFYGLVAMLSALADNQLLLHGLLPAMLAWRCCGST